MLLLDEPTSGLDPLMEQEFRQCVGEAVERGQTIFLSSHILSEVEQLCARVGILRAGHAGRGRDHRPSSRRCTAPSSSIDIDGEPPDLVQRRRRRAVCRATPTGVRVTFNGPPGPVLQAIDSLPLTAVRSQEASLEEIFLAYYGDGDRA